MVSLYRLPERDLLVETRDLNLVDPLIKFLNDDFGDRKQRIILSDAWTSDDFAALKAWLAAPVKAPKVPEGPPRFTPARHYQPGRGPRRPLVGAHS